jgi:formylglycine-generating enzyme required for sulfatase activity
VLKPASAGGPLSRSFTATLHRSGEYRADLRARIAAALALGRLGDPRFAHRRGPDGNAYLLPPLIAIPGGRYTLGSKDGEDDEKPVLTVKLAPFQLGQFPVTNAEWALFMQAGGYDDERWWATQPALAWQRGETTAEGPKQDRRSARTYYKDDAIFEQFCQRADVTPDVIELVKQWRAMSDDAFEAWLAKQFPEGRRTQPAFWDDEAFNQPAQPVVGICWYEVHAYCAWLSAQLGRSGAAALRLPSEAEWEAAARGPGARRCAYGSDFDANRCNTFESHIRRTTPIGVFPDGVTPEGVHEMSGNIWEWTDNLYRDYAKRRKQGWKDAPDDTDRRVVRGGSWALSSGPRARCLPQPQRSGRPQRYVELKLKQFFSR